MLKQVKKKLGIIILLYLRFFAKLQLSKYKPLVIGITGTSGKSSCQKAITAVLKEDFQVKTSDKANSESGIPLNILDLNIKNYSAIDWLRVVVLAPIKLLTNWKKYDTYVVEMGIDSPDFPKNMEYLLTIIKPTIGIFLNVGTVHGDSFQHLITKGVSGVKQRREIVNLIASEKGRLIESLPKEGVAILNSEDDLVCQFKNITRANQKLFGNTKESEASLKSCNVSLKKGTIFNISINGNKAQLNLKNHILPAHYAHNFEAAILVGLSFGLTTEKCMRLLEKNYNPPRGRSSLINGINDSFIIDSSYNSSIEAAKGLLKLAAKLKAKRKIAVLGDMRELGKNSLIDHQELADCLLKQDYELIVLVGKQMKKFVLPILNKANLDVEWFKNAYLAANYLRKKIKSGDLIIVKGSQNTIFLEIVVKNLMKNSDNADGLLCRRGKFWDKKRAELKG